MKNQDDRMRAIEHPNRNVDRENIEMIEMIELKDWNDKVHELFYVPVQ